MFSMVGITIVPKESHHPGLNARRVAKYSDVGHAQGCISETVQDMASGTINNYRNKKS